MGIYKKTALYFCCTLLVFTGARAILTVLYSDVFQHLTGIQYLAAYIKGLRFDLSSISAYFAIPLLLLLLPFSIARNSIWQKIWSTALFFVSIILSLALLGDIVYFNFVKRHVTYEFLFLKQFDELKTVLFMISGTYLPYLLCFIIAMVAGTGIWKRISAIPTETTIHKIDYGIYIGIFLVLAVFVRGGLGSKPIAIIDAFASGSTRQGNLILNGVFSMSHSLLKAENINHRFFDDSEALAILGHDTEIVNTENPFRKTAIATSTRYNLVFVLVESLSYKYIDSFAHNQYDVTENLDRMAKEGIRFTNFYANGQRSVEGIQATMTGIPPLVGMATIATGLIADHSKLGQMAENNGYSTIFLQSSKRRSLRIDSVAGSAGFREYYGMEDMPLHLDYPDPKASRWGWDYEMLMKAAERMEKVEKPFLVYAVTSTTHTPYPKPPAELVKHPHHTNNENGFLNTLNYTDWSIGQFINRVKTHPWFKDTIFIFTADHALAHYQTGDFCDRFHIPMIIYAPDIVQPAVIDTVASQVDIMPTIIDLLGLQGQFTAYGKSVFSASSAEGFALIKEGSTAGIITSRGYLRHSLKNRLETEFYRDVSSDRYFEDLERKLLASDQLVYKLLTTNRWNQ